MAQIKTRLMTVEEFRALPEDTGEVYHELRHGELVQMSRPKLKHWRTQRRIRQLLEPLATESGIVDTEIAFRALPEYELRVADVGFVFMERWGEADLEDNLHGAPDLVIEVLSPSNSASEILEKKTLYLKNGCREFWVIDPKTRQVEVSAPNGVTRTYQEGQEIPLTLFSGGTLVVRSIFCE
ncbi:MAG: Uma2 family endonuclease [Acidobacteriia bacterium]|nr:Uma2 family endonuclease [Terriglobia bacterium]